MGPPFQHASADQPAAFLEIETVEVLLVERSPGRGAKVEVPVDLFLGRLGFGRGPAAHVSRHPGRVSVDRLEFAELSRPGQLAGKREVRQVPPLGAGLEDHARATHRLGQRQALGDVLGARFFAIHILARTGRVDRRRGVPVGARGDQYGIDIAAVEQFTKVAIGFAVLIAILVVGNFFDRRTPIGLHVGHRHELHVRVGQETTKVIGAAVSDTDPAHHNPLAGGRGRVFTQRRAGNQAGRHQCGAGLDRPFQ